MSRDPRTPGWRSFLTREEAAVIRPLERRRKELRRELLEIFARTYPIQNRATQRRRAALKSATIISKGE